MQHNKMQWTLSILESQVKESVAFDVHWPMNNKLGRGKVLHFHVFVIIIKMLN